MTKITNPDAAEVFLATALSDSQRSDLERSRILEERLLRWIDEMQIANQEPGLPKPHDGRALSLARTNLETAFMWLNKAICKPPRLSLEDHDAAQA